MDLKVWAFALFSFVGDLLKGRFCSLNSGQELNGDSHTAFSHCMIKYRSQAVMIFVESIKTVQFPNSSQS